MRKFYNCIIILVFINSLHSQTGAWSLIAIGTTTNNLISVSAPNASVCYVSGVLGTILKTVDGGSTWVSQSLGNTQTLYSICFTDSSIGYVVGDTGVALKTINGGLSWSQMPIGTTNNLRNVYFFDANNGYITGGNSGSGSVPGTILKTTDAGATWTSLNTTGASNKAIYSAFFTSALVGYANDWNGNMLKTIDGGTNWISYPTGVTGLSGSTYFLNPTTGFVLGTGAVLTSTTSGASWSPVPLNDTASDNFNGIDFYDANNGFIFGGNIGLSTGYILSTNDGGLSWTTTIAGTSFLEKVDMVNANVGYGVGFGGTILKYSSDVSVIENKNPRGTYSVFPNPFCNKLSIYTYDASDKKAQIYNATGSLIYSETLENNQDEIDLTHLSEGMYFIRVGTTTKRIIKQ